MEKTDRTNVNETILRLLAMALCIAALVVMVKNSVSNDFGSVSYSSLGAYKYLVHANGVCAAYSLLTALAVAILCPTNTPRAFMWFFLDQVFTYVVLGAGAVSAQVVYLAYNGSSAITWSSVCDSYGVFCHKALVSVSITFVVVLLYVLLSMISSYRVFSKYDALMTQNPPLGTPDAASRS